MDMRDQILSTATRLFARHGFDGTSLSSIAEEVGIKKPSLLYHFRSKEVLRESVLDELVKHFGQLLPQVLSSVASGRARFDALTRGLVEFFLEDPDRARLVVRELMDRPEAMREHFVTAVRPWIAMLRDYIERGKSEGLLRPDVDSGPYLVHVITVTLAGIAARPVLVELVEGEDCDRRYIEELLRIARTSLFVDRPSSSTERERKAEP